ncbi:MAG: Fe-S protein assembly co-chaperone HscB [Zoogloeaceae bacterium]|nr:Fe-S protein assembly co-chaperone HscB [Zoogloeaceae bacterium]MCK6384295.1 Fe-S protein assembly co-chaperone HscB [Rhodocyclaceae bacterium]
MIPDFSQDYFALFALPRAYRIDAARLDQAYHAMQGKVHPDRHAHLPETERRLSMQWATQVNEAYRTLKQPLLRAHYLLRLAGAETDHESNTAMTPAFLMEQMEWREAVAEARAAGDHHELEKLMQRLERHAGEIRGEIEQSLDAKKDYEAAADAVRRLMFMEKLEHEIEDALEALEN